MNLPRAQPPPGAVAPQPAEKPAASHRTSTPEKHKLIVDEEYEKEELIGGGSYGHVYRCRHLASGKTVAIKNFKKRFGTAKKAFDQREVKILQKFDEIDKRGPGSHCPFVMKADRIEYENT